MFSDSIVLLNAVSYLVALSRLACRMLTDTDFMCIHSFLTEICMISIMFFCLCDMESVKRRSKPKNVKKTYNKELAK